MFWRNIHDAGWCYPPGRPPPPLSTRMTLKLAGVYFKVFDNGPVAVLRRSLNQTQTSRLKRGMQANRAKTAVGRSSRLSESATGLRLPKKELLAAANCVSKRRSRMTNKEFKHIYSGVNLFPRMTASLPLIFFFFLHFPRATDSKKSLRERSSAELRGPRFFPNT